MGDPKKLRKQYQTPMHPWNKESIEVESKIKHDYGLLRKKEIFKMNSFLKKYRAIAKRLSTDDSNQSQKEAKDVLTKLNALGLVPADAQVSDILSLELKDILDRRLQSVVYRKGLARSMKQSRQFITHRHIVVGDKEITSPSFLITTENESKITFKGKSTLADESHPERSDPNKDIKEELAKIRGKKAEGSKEETATATKTAEVKENSEAPVVKAEVKVAAKEEESKESNETPETAESKEEAPSKEANEAKEEKSAESTSESS